MKLTPRSLLLVPVVAALGVSGPASAKPRDPCLQRGSTTTALNKQQRIYRDTSGVYHTCLRSTGRTTGLFASDDIYTSGSLRVVLGRFVAYDESEIPGCKADCPPGVTTTHSTSITDAATGTTRLLSHGPVGAIRVRTNGSVAWVAYSGSEGAILWTWPAGGTAKRVDTGDITEVHLTRGTLWWKNAGVAKAAPFS